MAIVNGRFVPDNMGQANQMQSQNQQMSSQPNMQMAGMSPSPQGVQIAPMGPPAPNQQTMQKGPQQGNITPSNPMAAPAYANQQAMKVGQPMYQAAQGMQTMQQQLGAPQTAYKSPYQFTGQGFVNQFGGHPQMQPNYNYNQTASYGGMQSQQMPQQSVEQSVQGGNPQSVQNFLSALGKVGAGGNNNFMNPQGQQGQQAQGGFQGFGVNGQMAGPAAQMYSGPMQSQLGWNQNMAGSNYGPSSVQNYAQQGQYGGGGGYQAGGINQGSAGSSAMGGSPAYIDPTPTEDQLRQRALSQAQQAQQFLGQWSATSDSSAKENITPGEFEIDDFLNNLGTYSYEYKDKQYGDGRRISPMAQEIEKSPLGMIAISTNKEGYKQVDYGKLGGTMLAALAMQNKRINDLQEQMKNSIPKSISAKKKGK